METDRLLSPFLLSQMDDALGGSLFLRHLEPTEKETPRSSFFLLPPHLYQSLFMRRPPGLTYPNPVPDQSHYLRLGPPVSATK